MSSLSARLLISVSVLLLLFFGATVIVLDTAFRTAGEQARRDILDGHLMQLLAAANPNDEGALSFPPDLHEERFNTIGSGLRRSASRFPRAGFPGWVHAPSGASRSKTGRHC
jgi:hypothetical protein